MVETDKHLVGNGINLVYDERTTFLHCSVNWAHIKLRYSSFCFAVNRKFLVAIDFVRRDILAARNNQGFFFEIFLGNMDSQLAFTSPEVAINHNWLASLNMGENVFRLALDVGCLNNLTFRLLLEI